MDIFQHNFRYLLEKGLDMNPSGWNEVGMPEISWVNISNSEDCLKGIIAAKDFVIRNKNLEIQYLKEQLNKAKIVEEVLRGLLKG